MKIAESRITSQGQISVPAEVRKRLGLAPGSVLEWDADDDGRIVVRPAHKTTFEDIRKMMFPPDGVVPEHLRGITREQMNEGIREHMRKRYGRR